MAAVWQGDRVYHKDDPTGARGDVLEVRDFGERGVRALVKWDLEKTPTWGGIEHLRHAQKTA